MQILNFLKGIVIGIALVIPGLSGSIFAVITGLYDDIIVAINNIKKDFLYEFVFLSPILVGVLVGILISTKLVLYVCITYPIYSYSFFIGLVLGSFSFIFNKFEKTRFTLIDIAVFTIALCTMIFLSSIESSTENSYIVIEKISNLKDFLTIVFAGVFSSSLMIIPGVSGSILLMIINQYGTVYNAIANTSDLIVSLIKGDFHMAYENFQSFLVILPFAVGGIVGIWFISKLLLIVINNYKKYLYLSVMGIMVSAIITLLKQGIIENFIYFGTGIHVIMSITICICFIIIGCFISKSYEA